MRVLDANPERSLPDRSARHSLLSVHDLTVNFRLDHEREAGILKQISVEVGPAEIVGVLGESGAGKTTMAFSLMQLLPENARIANGSIHFRDRDLLTLNSHQLREVRGAQISIIHQDSDALNPVMRAGDQVTEVLRAHKPAKAAQMREEIYCLFAAMGLKDRDRIYRSYPHQLSGGERRRVAIAQALVCKPSLVIADEPTAWLDSHTAAEILSVFEQLREMHHTAFLLITHDPDVLRVADRVLVMYAGEIVEDAAKHEIFAQPKHPYTKALLQCNAQRNAARLVNKPQSLPCIPGQAPDPFETHIGCAFSSRCSDHREACNRRNLQLQVISDSCAVRCVQYEVGS
jgi:oligopeptide/dipeptide ABC transporter ATP-binding protein